MKKKLMVFCLAASIALSINAQEKVKDKDIPAPVQTSFKSQYPDASGADWKIKEGNYKVHFKAGGSKQLAVYDPSGTIMSKGIQITETELPAAVSTAAKSSYADRSIDEVYKIDKNGTITYLVKLKGTPETSIIYSGDGQVIKEKPGS